MPAGSNVDLGDNYIIGGLSASTLDMDLVPAMDVSHWKWISIYITSDVYDGLLMPQSSFTPDDESSWKNMKMYLVTSLDANDAAGYGFRDQNIIAGFPVIAPWFRMRMTEYTSGAATGIIQLSSAGLPGFQLVNTFTTLKNDGLDNISIASGESDDTVVQESGGVLSSILVTEQNTHQMTIYDNDSDASGTIIGIIPANQAVDGIPFKLSMPAHHGIYVKGNANNPGVTIAYAMYE